MALSGQPDLGPGAEGASRATRWSVGTLDHTPRHDRGIGMANDPWAPG